MRQTRNPKEGGKGQEEGGPERRGKERQGEGGGSYRRVIPSPVPLYRPLNFSPLLAFGHRSMWMDAGSAGTA